MSIAINQALVEQAGQLADGFALRAYDSVQLAAALFVQRRTQSPVTFACFDDRLNRAAALLEMQTPFLLPMR
ncbi:MAG: hypothetical protein EPN14_05425 [Gallionella sp.]|nr:MAG: hypothetical protein EPN14_05425 [Gallionella sp.]